MLIEKRSFLLYVEAVQVLLNKLFALANYLHLQK